MKQTNTFRKETLKIKITDIPFEDLTLFWLAKKIGSKEGYPINAIRFDFDRLYGKNNKFEDYSDIKIGMMKLIP